jgi:uncharacterized protein (TIGR00730 family)
MPTIAVFGSSEPVEGDELYREARELGGLLARAGHTVLTGGYGGVMEAASRGAREAGGRTVGVTCRIFAARQPNPYLDRVVSTADLHERTRELIVRAEGFVVLDGKAGTLAELSFLWALERAGCLDSCPVVVLGVRLRGLIEELKRCEMLETPQIAATRLARSPREAVRLLETPSSASPS